MSVSTRSSTQEQELRPNEAEACTEPELYDRSSLKGDYMVMIADQTEDDFLRLAPESRSCDYIDGIVYMPSPVNTRHQETVLFLADLLNGYRHERGGGRVLLGPAALKLAPRRYPEPDIFVMPPVVARPAGEVVVTAAASVVVEVQSPSTRKHDLGLKASIYRDAAIPELWFVHPRESAFIVEKKVGEIYETARLCSGYYVSTVLPGFWIDVA